MATTVVYTQEVMSLFLLLIPLMGSPVGVSLKILMIMLMPVIPQFAKLIVLIGQLKLLILSFYDHTCSRIHLKLSNILLRILHNGVDMFLMRHIKRLTNPSFLQLMYPAGMNLLPLIHSFLIPLLWMMAQLLVRFMLVSILSTPLFME